MSGDRSCGRPRDCANSHAFEHIAGCASLPAPLGPPPSGHAVMVAGSKSRHLDRDMSAPGPTSNPTATTPLLPRSTTQTLTRAFTSCCARPVETEKRRCDSSVKHNHDAMSSPSSFRTRRRAPEPCSCSEPIEYSWVRRAISAQSTPSFAYQVERLRPERRSSRRSMPPQFMKDELRPRYSFDHLRRRRKRVA